MDPSFTVICFNGGAKIIQLVELIRGHIRSVGDDRRMDRSAVSFMIIVVWFSSGRFSTH